MIGAIYALLVVTAALVVEGRTMSPFTEIAISRETTDPLNSSPVLSGAKRQDSPLGGGATVLGTYYIEVKANGQKLRLQLVRCARESEGAQLSKRVQFKKPLA